MPPSRIEFLGNRSLTRDAIHIVIAFTTTSGEEMSVTYQSTRIRIVALSLCTVLLRVT